MKKVIALCLCLIMMFSIMIPAFASGMQPYSNNVTSTNASFVISNTGKATVSIEYFGKSGVTQSAEITTKVQKKVGIIWITVSNGSWTDHSTATNYSTTHSVQLSSKATYRAHVVFTISGTGGSDDKITKNIEKVYS